MGKKPPKWLPGERVNETILTQRKSVEELRADRVLRKPKLKDQRSRMKAKLDAKRKKKLATKKFIPAEAILQKTLKAERLAKGYWKRGEKFNTRISRKSDEKKAQQYQNAPVALVVRTSGKQIPKEASTSLAKLGLTKMYQARLVHLNPNNDRLCKMLKTFVTVGFPTTQQAETLIRTRGSFWNPETKSKAYINGNLQVEQTLGSYNILSIEELVDAIVGKSEHIDEVLKYIAPFDFHPPRTLYMERHRSAHEKLEIENPTAFSSYLESQLVDTARERHAAKVAEKKTKKLTEAQEAKSKKKVVSGKTAKEKTAAVQKAPPKKEAAAVARRKKATGKK